MPIVRIEMWAGRSREMRASLIKNVTKAVVDSLGCPIQAVDVVLVEVDKTNWGEGGEIAADRQPTT